MLASLTTSLRHLFTPHEHNNFRARLLHNTGILVVLGIFLVFNFFVSFLDDPRLHILGFTSTITIDEVVSTTNQERLAAGLTPLQYSDTLADAARRKAANMLEENYWAHNSPSGLTPWHWFAQAGYPYLHAGENLAKDFGSTDRMLAAWMDSPTHKANILSSNYTEIGLAVVPGTLQGQETVLVVQLFGTHKQGAVPADAVASPDTQGVTSSTPQIAQLEPPPSTPAPSPALPTDYVSASTNPTTFALFNEFSFKQLMATATTILLLLALVFDLAVAESRALSRRVGKNWAHILYINIILILVTIVQAGRIL